MTRRELQETVEEYRAGRDVMASEWWGVAQAVVTEVVEQTCRRSAKGGMMGVRIPLDAEPITEAFTPLIAHGLTTRAELELMVRDWVKTAFPTLTVSVSSPDIHVSWRP